MNYVDKNNQILNEWRSKYHKQDISCDFFAEDGIMFRGEFDHNGANWLRKESEDGSKENDLWANAPLRILYLTKDQPSVDDGAWDLREECYHHPNSSIEDYKLRRQYAFHRNLVFSLYGFYCSIQGKIPLFEDVSSPSLEPEVLRVSDEFPFARINCKKIVGGSNCPQEELEEALKNDEKFLKQQINSLDANLIICCGHQNGQNAILEMLNRIGYNFPSSPEDDDCYDVYYDEKKQVVAIDSYHLSYFGYGGANHYKDLVQTWQAFLKKHPGFLQRR